MAPVVRRRPAARVIKRPAVRVATHTRRARKVGLKYKQPSEAICKRCGQKCPMCNPPPPPCPAPEAAVAKRPVVNAVIVVKVE